MNHDTDAGGAFHLVLPTRGGETRRQDRLDRGRRPGLEGLRRLLEPESRRLQAFLVAEVLARSRRAAEQEGTGTGDQIAVAHRRLLVRW